LLERQVAPSRPWASRGMTFWGTALKAGQRLAVDVPTGEVLHLSQVCLHEPKAGKNYLQVIVGGTTYSACCLEKDKVEHASLDLFFGADSPTFVNKGNTDIHMSGYIEPIDEDEEGSEEEETKPPAKAAPKAKASAAKAEASPKAAPKAKAEASPKAAPKAKAEAAKPAAKEDDDDDEESEEGDEEGEEEEAVEPSEEEDPAPAETKKKAALEALAKRKAADQAAPPAKKAKSEGAAAATAPAAASKATSSKEAEYVQAVVDFLKANGKQKLSDLGAKVKRPQGVPKMRAVVDANKDKLVLTGDVVSLKE